MGISYLSLVIIINVVLPFIFASVSIVDVPVSKDAYIYFNSYACAPPCYLANWNFGNESVVHLANYHLTTTGAIGFDITHLPHWTAGTTEFIDDISLYLPPLSESFAYTDSFCEISVNRITSSWNEYTITANNLPTIDTSNTLIVYNSRGSEYASVNVTSIIQGGTGVLAFYLRSSSGRNCAFRSREYVGSAHAFVRITYRGDSATVACGAPVDIGCEACCNDNVNGPTCYVESTHDCVSGSEGNRICANNARVCKTTCYDPTSSTCIDESILCPIGSRSCAGACYNDSYVCIDGYFLCPAGMKRCQDACYNDSQYSCVGGALQPK